MSYEIWVGYLVAMAVLSALAYHATSFTKPRDGETKFGCCVRWLMFLFVLCPIVVGEAIALMLGVKLLFGE